MPNSLGWDLETASALGLLLENFVEDLTVCYSHVKKLASMLVFPRCVNRNGVANIITPCRRMCRDFVTSCRDELRWFKDIVSCRYLTDLGSCLYEPVTCPKPTSITNGYVKKIQGLMATNRTIYKCNFLFNFKNTSFTVCGYNGKWSKPLPKCVLDYYFIISVSIIGAVLAWVALFIVCYRYRFELDILCFSYFGIRLQKTTAAKLEDMTYDAFVSYATDDDSKVARFVISFLEDATPPFRVCHPQAGDIRAGANLLEELALCINTSRVMFALLTQAYVNSNFCRFEFRCAMERVLEDSGFKLVVVLLEPFKDLRNAPEEMRSYLKTRHYIEAYDRDVIAKRHRILYTMPDGETVLMYQRNLTNERLVDEAAKIEHDCDKQVLV